MRFPGRALLAASPLLLAGSPAAAQRPFEGVITMRVGGDAVPQPMTMQYMVRNGALRSEVNTGGMQGVSLFDPAKGEMYIIMPARRMYMVMPVPAEADARAGGREPQVTKTGRKETVAGHECEHWTVKADTLAMDVCVASSLSPVLGLQGGMGRGAGGASWTRLLPKNGGMALKVSRLGDSRPLMEVTKVEAKSLDASLFALPDGYQRMQMPGGPPRRP
jgi:Domain of unknown function (DUF4412)